MHCWRIDGVAAAADDSDDVAALVVVVVAAVAVAVVALPPTNHRHGRRQRRRRRRSLFTCTVSTEEAINKCFAFSTTRAPKSSNLSMKIGCDRGGSACSSAMVVEDRRNSFNAIVACCICRLFVHARLMERIECSRLHVL